MRITSQLKISQLLADYPLLLFLDTGTVPKFPGRDASTVYVDRESGFLGPQAANKGPYRFSLQKYGSTGAWNPLAAVKLVNGEEVSLWCHSIDVGGWRSLNEPPSQARQAFWNQQTKSLELDTAKLKHSTVGGYEPAKFVVEIV